MIWLEVLERAWKELRKEKTEAKEAKKNIMGVDRLLAFRLERIKTTKEVLSDSYRLFPRPQRTDYVQKTLDLLDWSEAFYQRLKHNLQVDLKTVRLYWKDRNYKKVIEICNNLIDEIKTEIDKWEKNIES